MILQKTYVTDPISKKVKQNNGELPKIYIKNNHVPIISREQYESAQQERARRGSKRKVSKRSATEQSKYSSVHALTELLVCGDCGTPYRRDVWTKRSGEKQAVWRCISRLDYGTKYCKDSITLDEDSLRDAVMQAITATWSSRQEMIPVLTTHLSRSMREQSDGSFNVELVERQISELKAAAMALISESIGSNSVTQNEARLKAMSDEIKELHDAVLAYRESTDSVGFIEGRISGITDRLESEPQGCTWDDCLVRQLVDSIKVVGDDKLIIRFRIGLEYEQAIAPKVRKINRVA